MTNKRENIKVIKNINLFSSAGIGEYGTNNMEIINERNNKEKTKIKTIIANE